MYGAALGDMIGAPYEFVRGPKCKDFPLFIRQSEFTDDTVMTMAVADALMRAGAGTDGEKRAALVQSMQKWGRRFPDAGYGGMFHSWLQQKQPRPYGSFGNGSAMRVSSVGWLYDSIDETRHAAALTAEVTHNHPEGIKGAQAVACAIYLARTGSGKEEIRAYITREFGYDLGRSCDEIRPGYSFDVTCQGTVPEAFAAFLEGESFEDVIRTAVSLGGDCDTLTCIAGSMAEAYYGVPEELKEECLRRLPPALGDVLVRFDRYMKPACSRTEAAPDGSEGARLKSAAAAFKRERTQERLKRLLFLLRGSPVWVPCSAVFAPGDEENMERALRDAGDDPESLVGMEFTAQQEVRMVPDILQNGDNLFFPVFSDAEEMGEYGEAFSKVQMDMAQAAAMAMASDRKLAGMVLNAFTEAFVLPADMLGQFAEPEDGHRE